MTAKPTTARERAERVIAEKHPTVGLSVRIAGEIEAAESAAREEGFTAAVEAAAQLHESVNPASDMERLHGDPGAGAMGAVIEYRDKIRLLEPR